jgi:protein involved in polysaccharide export with SLBB domain
MAQETRIVAADRLPRVVERPYEVQVGDVLSVDFFKTTDLNQVRTIGPDGDMFLPLVGRVTVAHRTIDDITRELTERYSEEMVNPQITVSVKEYSGLQVYVAGEVVQPGIQTYHGKLTLVQAIMAAGGFTPKARWKEVLLIRRGPDDQPVGALIDVKQIVRKGGLGNDIPLAPMDTIYVHHKKIVNVNLFVEQYISDNIPDLKGWWWWITNTSNH